MRNLDKTCLQLNTDFHGGDLNTVCTSQPTNWKRETPDECQLLCQQTDGCELFTWIGPDDDWIEARQRCCLKTKVNQVPTVCYGAVSGTKYCGNCNTANYMFNLINPYI